MKISNVLLLSSMCSFSVMDGYGVEFEDITVITHGSKVQQDLTPYAGFKDKLDLSILKNFFKIAPAYEDIGVLHKEFYSYIKKYGPLLLQELISSKDCLSLIQLGDACVTLSGSEEIFKNKIKYKSVFDQCLENKLEIIQKKAKDNHLDFQYLLAKFYRHGVGVVENADIAERWFKTAANGGHACAQFMCGRTSLYVMKNDSQAAEWFTKAAEQGCAPAQVLLSDLLERGFLKFNEKEEIINVQDSQQSLKWLEEAAMQNYPSAKFKLATRYHFKGKLDEAFNLYEELAKQGMESAQFNLAICYLNREGGKEADFYRGVYWLKKAQKNGNEQAPGILKYLQEAYPKIFPEEDNDSQDSLVQEQNEGNGTDDRKREREDDDLDGPFSKKQK